MLEAIKNRRNTRKFNTLPVEDEKILEVIKSGMQAPCSKDSRPWEFIIVDKRDLLDNLASVHHAAKPLHSAQVCIVLCGNRNKFHKAGRWILDLSACMENMFLEAINQELCGGWIGCFPRKSRMDHARGILNLPKNIEPFCILTLGYSDVQNNYFKDKFDPSKIHRNKF